MVLIISASCTACQTNTTTRQITLAPSSRYWMETKPTLSVLGQFAEIPSVSDDQMSCFLNRNTIHQVFTLEGKEDWRRYYQFPVSVSGYPKPIFCLNKPFLVMVDLNACYQVDTTVNAKTELFTYSEIAYDQEWVIWKETPKNTSQKPTSATIANWVTQEKVMVKIPSDIESLEVCAGYLVISTRAKPDDVKKWWVFDTKTKKLTSMQVYGELFYSSPKSDILYWSSEEKSQWTLFSLANKKMLKNIPFSKLPKGLLIPYTNNAQEAFWFIQKADQENQTDKNAVLVELTHGLLGRNHIVELTPLLLPDAYVLPAFTPEIEPCLWLKLADNRGKFYRLSYNATNQYILDEVIFPTQNALQETVYVSSSLTGSSNRTIMTTNQAIYSFRVKEVALIVE